MKVHQDSESVEPGKTPQVYEVRLFFLLMLNILVISVERKRSNAMVPVLFVQTVKESVSPVHFKT